MTNGPLIIDCSTGAEISLSLFEGRIQLAVVPKNGPLEFVAAGLTQMETEQLVKALAVMQARLRSQRAKDFANG